MKCIMITATIGSKHITFTFRTVI